jgi:RimJ/RimL family protein N-acetyltransferase
MAASPDIDLRNVALSSARLTLRSFSAADAAEAFAAATGTLTRFMGWDPSPSLSAFAGVWREWLPAMAAGTDLMPAIRLASTGEFLGMAGLHGIGSSETEVGIWLKEAAHGLGYGREAVAAIVNWAYISGRVIEVIYPVVVDNCPSRHLVESLGGVLIGNRQLRKPSGEVLDEVVYRIPPPVT